MILNNAVSLKRQPNFDEVLKKCGRMLEKISGGLSTAFTDFLPSSSTTQNSSAKYVLPPKLRLKRNSETASAAQQVDEEVGVNSAYVRASSSAVPDSPLIQLWPPKSPAKRNNETASAAQQFSEKVAHNSDCVRAAKLSWWLHWLGVGLVIERSQVQLPAGALSSQLGQLSLPSLRGR